MTFPITVTFRGIEPSAAVDAYVRRRASKLDRWFDEVQMCRVAVEAPHRRHTHGNPFHIRISIAVPGDAVFVSRPTDLDPKSQDVYAAIDGAFDDAGRCLSEFSRRRRSNRRELTLKSA